MRRLLFPNPYPLSPKKGFTLVEIMLVVVIIAALAAMIMPRLAGRSEQANKARARAEISSNMGLALKLYELDNGNYPTTEQGLEALMTKSATSPVPQNWNGPYLEKKPIDPWGKPYQYKCPGVHSKMGFDLFSVGKDGQEGTEDDVTNWE
ncbi:MAG: type II secretion system major pseudopilin GspG [Candidatus Omnitrophica bacterium]|nr:type II secretion system major pseudopilin GspG [Candidatus Omnitrophota bacterium]